MTAVPLTLEDLERLEQHWSALRDSPVWKIAAADMLPALAALRSVMDDLDETHADLAHTSRELEKARGELRSVMADAEGLRDALMVAERMIESREKEANEAREQVRSLTVRLAAETARADEHDESLAVEVRSLTVERDQWKADRDQAYAFWKREQARADGLAGDFGEASRERDALRARLSRAREALAAWLASVDGREQHSLRCWNQGSGRIEGQPCVCGFAALRAVLTEETTRG